MGKSADEAASCVADPLTELLEALRSLPKAERRLVLLAYAAARPRDTERKTYVFEAENLANGLVTGLDELGHRVQELGRKLLKRPLLLSRPEGGWSLIPWLSALESRQPSGGYAIRLQPELKSLMLELSRRASLVPFDAYLRLEGKYSPRILEMLLAGCPDKKPARDYWEVAVPLGAIRSAFELEERYAKAKALKKWVVMGAVNEINLAELGLRVEVETMLQGKKTKGFLFKVKRRGSGTD